MFICGISIPHVSLLDNVRQEVAESTELTKLVQEINLGTTGSNWAFSNGLVTYKGRVYLPTNSPLIPNIISSIHNATHEGIQKTLYRVQADFYWQGQKASVREFIQNCSVCQQNKWENLHLAGLLQPLSIPMQIWAAISMNFIDGLPKVRGKSVLYVVVDRFSKYAHFIPLSHSYSATSVVHVFFTQIFRLHGLPESIVSDRDPVFTSNFWRELFRLSGTSLAFSSAYHPQSDGQTEVVNRMIEMYLRCFVGDQP